MLRHVLTTMLLTVSIGTGAATACWKPIFTDEELRWIGDHPVVHIAVEANWHPIEYMRNGRHAGLVAGYLSAISKMTGLSFQTVPGTESGHAYDALAAGKVDLLPGVWRELVPDRVGSGALVSAPYLVGRLTVVTRNNSAMIFGLQGLKGRRIAIKGRGGLNTSFATAAGAVTLRVRYVAARHGRSGTLCLEVRDTGIGIAPDRLGHVFETYWQADRAPQPGSGGSGLGLAICRELVELMHGSIAVDSTPHVETVFTVQLPVPAADGAPLAKSATAAQALADATAAPVYRGAPRVLIVDDHETVRAALQDQYDALGCVGIVAGSGEDALRHLAQGRIDMVLLDCNLPDIDGYALARMIRQEEAVRKARRVSIIAISAESGDMHRMLCLESGMDGVLGKPLRLDTLRQAIARWYPTDADNTLEVSTVP
jgi:CheY-like chemotaxis protein